MSMQKISSFNAYEFDYFKPELRRNKVLDQHRLKVKRKLHQIGKILLPELKKEGFEVVFNTSLHHPYIYNRFAVDSLWLYFSPSPDSCEELKTLLGPYIGKDLKKNYNHTTLVVGIEYDGLFIALKIHPQAWWDGQNLKNKCKKPDQRKEFLLLLNQLEGYHLLLDNLPHKRICKELRLEGLKSFFKYYIPGEHWLHLKYCMKKEDKLATNIEFINFAKKQLLLLQPVYKFIRWNTENNYL